MFPHACARVELVHNDDLTLGFIRLNNLPAMYAVEINNGQEYLLCFNGQCFATYRYTCMPNLQLILSWNLPNSYQTNYNVKVSQM